MSLKKRSNNNRLLIDCRLINGSGISTYIINLLHQYRQIEHGLNIELLVNNFDDLLPHKQIAQRFPQHLFHESVYSIGEQINTPKILKQTGVLHVPHYNAPVLYDGKLIITVHDICHHAMKEFFPGFAKGVYSSIFLKKVLNRADKIITDSEFSKSEIQKYFHIESGKIKVIHLSVDPHFFPRSRNEVDAAKKKYKLPEEYLLYVGNIRPHKNIAGTIRGYGIALLNNSDTPPLVLCGSRLEGYDVFAELQTFSALEQDKIKQNVIFTSYLSYEDLPAVYTGATCLLFLSFYEGFGIPPLEAIACKTPVIASNISSVPEVLEDNALFVSPYEPEAIADAIEKLLSDSSFRHNLIEQSGKILQKYDWKETAIQHLEIYQQFFELPSPGKSLRLNPPSQGGIKKEKKPNKILFLEQYGNRIGGGQTILLDIVRYLKQSDRWDITVSLPEEGVFTQLLKNEDVQCVIHPVGSHSIDNPMLLDLFRYSVSSLKSALRLSSFIKQENIQLVYCNGGRTFLISILLGLFNPVKVIWHLHLIMVGRQKKMISWFGKFSKIFRIISVSVTARQAFHGTYVLQKIQTIYNWVSPELLNMSHLTSFSDTPSRIWDDRSVAPNLGNLKCLVIGQISKEKGQLQLLRQIRQSDEIKIELDFAGKFDSDRKHEKKMKEFVSELNGEGHIIRLLGFQRNRKELLSNYRFLIIPSLAPESFGLTAIEAMSQGVIVIANKLGGLPEIMEHGQEGFFYNASEPLSLSILLKEVMEGKYDLETIRKEALHKVLTKFHPDSQLKLIEGLITQATN